MNGEGNSRQLSGQTEYQVKRQHLVPATASDSVRRKPHGFGISHLHSKDVTVTESRQGIAAMLERELSDNLERLTEDDGIGMRPELGGSSYRVEQSLTETPEGTPSMLSALQDRETRTQYPEAHE